MKYYVTYKIDARYTAEVDANSIEEAMDKAKSEYYDADFGVAEDIDAETIMVQNKEGDYLWER